MRGRKYPRDASELFGDLPQFLAGDACAPGEDGRVLAVLFGLERLSHHEIRSRLLGYFAYRVDDAD